MNMHSAPCFILGSSRVAAHRKTHAERECVCTMCGKKFINKHKLKIHEDGVHGSSVLFPVKTTCGTQKLSVSVSSPTVRRQGYFYLKRGIATSENVNERPKPWSCSLADLGRPSKRSQLPPPLHTTTNRRTNFFSRFHACFTEILTKR